MDGSASADPDNNITNYNWKKISGPVSGNILNVNAVQTQVTNLVQGVYQFELAVTDTDNLFSKDTMYVYVNSQTLTPPPTLDSSCPPSNRPIINAKLIPVGNLSVARAGIAVTPAGDKIFFAGGYSASGMSSRVDIYDVTSHSRNVAELSLPCRDVSAIASGDRVLFAGGLLNGNLHSSRVDIYNTTSQSWSIAELSQARHPVVSATVGNKIFFAGGLANSFNTWSASSRVDIYDIATGTWGVTNLSEPRMNLTATTAGNKIYFAGGWNGVDGSVASNKIDIYEDATNSWSASTLSLPKAYHAAYYKNGKIYWIGGAVYIDWANDVQKTCNVEIRDINVQQSTFTNLSWKDKFPDVYAKDNKFIYLHWVWVNSAVQYYLDIYDITTNNWSIGVFNQSVNYLSSSVVSNNNTIYLAGGYRDNGGNGGLYTSQVYKIDF